MDLLVELTTPLKGEAELHAPAAGNGGGVGPDSRNVLQWLRHLADGDRLAALADESLISDLRLLEEVGRLVDAGRMFAADLVAQRCENGAGAERLCVREGFTGPEDMIAQATGTSTREVRERIRQAEPLRQAPPPAAADGQETVLPATPASPFPLLRRAVGSGLVSPEKASVITGALAPVRSLGVPTSRVAEAELTLLVAAMGADTTRQQAHEFGEDAPVLLAHLPDSGVQATGLTMTQLTRLARSWGRVLSQEVTHTSAPEDARATRRRQEARRFLTIHPLQDGMRRVEGLLVPEAAAQMERVLDAFLNPRTAKGSQIAHGSTEGDRDGGHTPAKSVSAVGGGRGRAGTGVTVPPDPRSARQKRHDALAGALSIAAGVPDMPLLGGSAPVLVVTSVRDQLGRADGAAFIQGTHEEADSSVDIAVAHHTGCSGAVQKLVLDPEGRVIELSTPQRIFTAHQRRAIATRDAGCIIPGCEVPATWCEIHHVHEWHEGGATHTDNGVTLCWHHHRSIDHLGWEIQMRDGVPWVRPPSSIDRHRRWAPAQTGLHRQFENVSRRSMSQFRTTGPSTNDAGTVAGAGEQSDMKRGADLHECRQPESAGGVSPPSTHDRSRVRKATVAPGTRGGRRVEYDRPPNREADPGFVLDLGLDDGRPRSPKRPAGSTHGGVDPPRDRGS